jgi:ribosomal protein S18 acetylase RimI-like enzyme
MMTENPEAGIRRLDGPAEAAVCARMMIATEPWITLRGTFERAYALLTDPAREVYVRAERGEVQGFIVLSLTGPFVGYIQVVCVAEAARGKGVGSELLAFAERRIAPLSPTVFLCVSSFNPRSRALYERLGYQQVGELPDYVERGYSEILMWKRRMSRNEFVAQHGMPARQEGVVSAPVPALAEGGATT